MVYRPDVADFIAAHRDDTGFSFVIPAGTTSGKTVRLWAPNIKMEFPRRGSETIRRVQVPFEGYPTTGGDDSLRIQFM